MRLGLGGIVAWGVVAGVLAACGSPPPPEPSAVINADPTAVCLGDGYHTTIHLDAKQSAPNLTLVYVRPDPGAPPLKYLWSFSGSDYQLGDGDDLIGEALSVTMAADRPLHVTLRVENAAGGVGIARSTIAVTPPDASGACPLPVK